MEEVFSATVKKTSEPRSDQTNINLSLDERPLFRLSQLSDQLIKPPLVVWRVLKPGKEIEQLAEITTVIESAGNRGEILEARADVARPLLKYGTTLILGEVPPGGGLPDRNQRSLCRLGPAQLFLPCHEGFALWTSDVALVTRDTTEDPATIVRNFEGGISENGDPIGPLQARSRDDVHSDDLPPPQAASNETRFMPWHRSTLFPLPRPELARAAMPAAA